MNTLVTTAAPSAAESTDSFPSATEFYLNFPLYERVKFPEANDKHAVAITHFKGPMDAYCPGCKGHSIFTRNVVAPDFDTDWFKRAYLDAQFWCTRNTNHHLLFSMRTEKVSRTIQKIGQYPSLADLSMHDVKQYSDVLAKPIFKELTKAIGLAAHGVGVGSFVYLRRIFEGLVEEAHQTAKNDEGWNEEEYQKGRMGEKILLLRNYLPEFLVENRALYGILSKGVHELSEDECLGAFPAVKVAIEIILDAKIEEAARRKKLEAAAKSIQSLAAKNR